LRIAHISDLHFSKISRGLGQLFSKAWLGNLNLIFNRNYDYSPEGPYALIALFKEQGVTDVIISGDLTTTSSKEEFELAQQFVHHLKKAGLNLYLVPGNHDHYTRLAYHRKIFYHYFEKKHSEDSSYNLADHGVTAKKFNSHWWLVLMDTTLATPLTSSNGCFTKKIEVSLKGLLGKIPVNSKVLLVNHFPFFPTEKPKRRLIRGPVLKQIIQNHPNIQFYLHGHTHKRCINDMRRNGLPIILDSGSTAYRHGSCYLLHLSENACDLTVFGWGEKRWTQIEVHTFGWPYDPCKTKKWDSCPPAQDSREKKAVF